MNFKLKYLQYKKQYLKLRDQKGGWISVPRMEEEDRIMGAGLKESGDSYYPKLTAQYPTWATELHETGNNADNNLLSMIFEWGPLDYYLDYAYLVEAYKNMRKALWNKSPEGFKKIGLSREDIKNDIYATTEKDAREPFEENIRNEIKQIVLNIGVLRLGIIYQRWKIVIEKMNVQYKEDMENKVKYLKIRKQVNTMLNNIL